MGDDSVTAAIFQSGFQSLLCYENKEAVIKELCHYHALDCPRSALEQFKTGLKTLGIYDLMVKHPVEFEKVFCKNERQNTPASVEKLFVKELAPCGTSDRERQERILVYWRDYLQECHGMYCILYVEDVQIKTNLQFYCNRYSFQGVLYLGGRRAVTLGYWLNIIGYQIPD